MYLSIKNLAIKYDIHPDTIRKFNLIQGFHYIRVNKLYRYHIDNMHSFILSLNESNNIKSFDDNLINRFLIES